MRKGLWRDISSIISRVSAAWCSTWSSSVRRARAAAGNERARARLNSPPSTPVARLAPLLCALANPPPRFDSVGPACPSSAARSPPSLCSAHSESTVSLRCPLPSPSLGSDLSPDLKAPKHSSHTSVQCCRTWRCRTVTAAWCAWISWWRLCRPGRARE